MVILRSLRLIAYVILLSSFSFFAISQESIPDSDSKSVHSITKEAIGKSKKKITREDLTQLSERGKLTVTKSKKRLRSIYHLDGINIQIVSESKDGDIIDLSFKVGSLVVDFSYGVSTNDFSINGYGTSLTSVEKVAFQSLSYKLDSEGWAKSRNLQKQLIYKATGWLSGTPVGEPISEISGKIQIDASASTGNGEAKDDASNDYAKSEVIDEIIYPSAPCENPDSALAPSASCPPPPPPCYNLSDNDNVTYFTCGWAYRTTSHDACPSHGLRSYTHLIGCTTQNDCVGRCGPGCGGTDGTGVYSQDCADHDMCCDVHGHCLSAVGNLCSDEWREAADDFLSFSNCHDCLNPEPPVCGGSLASTTTLLLGDGTNGIQISELNFDLYRSKINPGKPTFVEEWGILEKTGMGKLALKGASTEQFSDKLDSIYGSLEFEMTGAEREVLIIEAADGAHDPSMMGRLPTIRFEEKFPPGLLKKSESIWFRSEIDENGAVESVQILNEKFSDSRKLKEAISNGVGSSISSAMPHRMVVFGRAEAADRGYIKSDESLVLVPQCCGGGGGCSSDPNIQCP
ncbi:hypothetical protein JF535_11955 [Microbulbifer salipaludis]|uniref:DUF8213 domain-containing protein n=1 Tax=Microbulbifer salipaludis TaxID=187980 RepID=A0ABS3E8I1_9GAMM|nr:MULTISPECIES: hypothetical protein [Microbulbifer]MBN8431567.1 hypothetical protein [Microbulbifer salipaludis]MCK7596804.1 hypothetical protein [Microbulbifer sp. CAU 1566]